MSWEELKFQRWVRVLRDALWKDNPVYSMILGICTALAISNTVANAIAMGAGVTFVLFFTSLIVSTFRNLIPKRLRIITFMLTISSLVIVVDRVLAAYFPVISRALGPYVGLIITNCIIMGRAEAFAVKNDVFHSVLDGVGSGLGFTYTLLVIAVVRELLGFGTLLGYQITPAGWTNWVIMTMAPGAFFVFGVYLWIMRSLARIKPPPGEA